MNKSIKITLALFFAFASPALADDQNLLQNSDQFFQQVDNLVQEVEPKKTNQWSVTKLSLNAAKTHEGILGLLPFKGTATATLTWLAAHSAQNPQFAEASTESSESPKFDLSAASAQTELVATTYYREFLRAKKLPWNHNNEKDFINLFKQTRTIAEQIAQVEHPTWSLDQFVVERGLSLKGRLAPLATMEAVHAIRFSFDLKSVKRTRINPPGELTSLVLGLAEDISLSSKNFSLENWSVDGFQLGLGISPLLGLGVVNAKPFAFAYMIFKAKKEVRNNSFLESQVRNLTSDSVKFLDYSSSSSSMTLQTNNEKSFIVNREKFRQGLAAALQHAKQMTIKADKGDQTSKKWRLGAVTYRFDTGVQGQLLFSGLKGNVAAEVDLKKRLASRPYNLSDLDIQNQNSDYQTAMMTEMKEHQKIFSLTPATADLKEIESLTHLKFNFGIDTNIVDLRISAIPRLRLKFTPLK